MSGFPRQKRQANSKVHTRGWTVPEGGPALASHRKRSLLWQCAQVLMEIASQELKGSVKTLCHQVEKINKEIQITEKNKFLSWKKYNNSKENPLERFNKRSELAEERSSEVNSINWGPMLPHTWNSKTTYFERKQSWKASYAMTPFT